MESKLKPLSSSHHPFLPKLSFIPNCWILCSIQFIPSSSPPSSTASWGLQSVHNALFLLLLPHPIIHPSWESLLQDFASRGHLNGLQSFRNRPLQHRSPTGLSSARSLLQYRIFMGCKFPLKHIHLLFFWVLLAQQGGYLLHCGPPQAAL